MHWNIIHVGRITSTQDVAREYFQAGAKIGTVVVADSQSNGRGRQGRNWTSPPGGLYLTAILKMEFSASLLPLLTGVAIAETIQKEIIIDPVLKWPNDILIKGRKVGGVLLDVEWIRDQNVVLLGVGINLNNTLPDSIDNGTTLSEEIGEEIDSETFLRRLLQQLEKNLSILYENPEKILSHWERLTETLGKKLTIRDSNDIIYHGVAKSIDTDGALHLDCDGQTVKILSGTILGR